MESSVQRVNSSEANAFDLRGLLALCVKGNAAWLDRLGGYVRTQVAANVAAAKVLKAEMTAPLPLSDR